MSTIWYISGQLANSINGGSSGIPSMDQYSDAWKNNVEDWGQFLFGIPKGAWDTTNRADVTQAIAERIQMQLGHFAHDMGVWLVHLAPGICLVVCMASILGFMIGSSKCREYASVSALLTLIFTVVNKVV